jgi:hypothetical protein
VPVNPCCAPGPSTVDLFHGISFRKIVGGKIPGAKRRQLRLANMEMIGSLELQMVGEPHTLYLIKPPPL